MFQKRVDQVIEKMMADGLKQILVSELVLAEHATEDEVEKLVDSKINTSFMTFRADELNHDNNIVNKFIDEKIQELFNEKIVI